MGISRVDTPFGYGAMVSIQPFRLMPLSLSRLDRIQPDMDQPIKVAHIGSQTRSG